MSDPVDPDDARRRAEDEEFFRRFKTAPTGLSVRGRWVGAEDVEVTSVELRPRSVTELHMPRMPEALVLHATDGTELIRVPLKDDYAHCVSISDDPEGPLTSWNHYVGTFHAEVPLLPGGTVMSVVRGRKERWRRVAPESPPVITECHCTRDGEIGHLTWGDEIASDGHYHALAMWTRGNSSGWISHVGRADLPPTNGAGSLPRGFADFDLCDLAVGQVEIELHVFDGFRHATVTTHIDVPWCPFILEVGEPKVHSGQVWVTAELRRRRRDSVENGAPPLLIFGRLVSTSPRLRLGREDAAAAVTIRVEWEGEHFEQEVDLSRVHWDSLETRQEWGRCPAWQERRLPRR